MKTAEIILMAGYQDDKRFMRVLEVWSLEDKEAEKKAIKAWNDCKYPYKTLLKGFYGD